jgi:hypothetical protein
MSQAQAKKMLTTPLKKFTNIFATYAVTSLIIHFVVANTEPAWMIYFFTLVPCYILCYRKLSNLSTDRAKPGLKIIRYPVYPLIPIFILQALVILASPANCFGWHQGNDCYSLAQSYTEHALEGMSTRPHWFVGSLFFPLILIYIYSITYFWMRSRIENAS